MTFVHPDQALFTNTPKPASIACCDHYAGSEKLIRKSFELQNTLGTAFDITIDLEDGAGIGNEKQLRELAVTMILGKENVAGRTGIRIHDAQSPWWQDDIRSIVTAAGARLSHLTIPKVGSAAELQSVLRFLREVCRDAAIHRPIPVHALIETHGAVRDVWAIAQIPDVRGLDMGLMDFVSDHNGIIPASAMQSPEQFTHALVVRAKTEICAAASAFGKTAVHNVTTRFNDPQQTRSDARIARRQFGFTRMWSIHPAQISAIIEGMSPEAGEIQIASEVLLAGWKAYWAPIRHADKLHDRASYRYFWYTIQRARSAGLPLSDELERAFF